MADPEKTPRGPIPDQEKPTFVTRSTEGSDIEKEHLHIVQRSDALLDDTIADDAITGYDPILMRARATLSAEEEKKVIRRIDWRLIPLLSVMYMVKSIDATNVC
jgi:hypothetical protein